MSPIGPWTAGNWQIDTNDFYSFWGIGDHPLFVPATHIYIYRHRPQQGSVCTAKFVTSPPVSPDSFPMKPSPAWTGVMFSHHGLNGLFMTMTSQNATSRPHGEARHIIHRLNNHPILTLDPHLPFRTPSMYQLNHEKYRYPMALVNRCR